MKKTYCDRCGQELSREDTGSVVLRTHSELYDETYDHKDLCVGCLEMMKKVFRDFFKVSLR